MSDLSWLFTLLAPLTAMTCFVLALRHVARRGRCERCNGRGKVRGEEYLAQWWEECPQCQSSQGARSLRQRDGGS